MDCFGAGHYQWHLNAVIVLYPFKHVIGLTVLMLINRGGASSRDNFDLLIYKEFVIPSGIIL